MALIRQSRVVAKGQWYHVGGSFAALYMGLLMAASNFSCNCFRIQTSENKFVGLAPKLAPFIDNLLALHIGLKRKIQRLLNMNFCGRKFFW